MLCMTLNVSQGIPDAVLGTGPCYGWDKGVEQTKEMQMCQKIPFIIVAAASESFVAEFNWRDLAVFLPPSTLERLREHVIADAQSSGNRVRKLDMVSASRR